MKEADLEPLDDLLAAAFLLEEPAQFLVELLHRDVFLLNRGAQSLILVLGLLSSLSFCCWGLNDLVSTAKLGRTTTLQVGGGGGSWAAALSARLEAFSGLFFLGGPGEDPLAAVFAPKQLVQIVPELFLTGAWLLIGGP